MFKSKRFWAAIAALVGLVGAVCAGELSTNTAIMTAIGIIAAFIVGDSIRPTAPK